MRVVDLFCGAGGMSLGLRRAGFAVVRGYDFWEPALAIHEANLKSFLANLTKNKQAHRRNLGGFDTKALRNVEDIEDLEKFIPEIEALGDILTLIPEIVDLAPDMIVGGPPCQPWSLAGLKLGDRDPRAKLTDAFGIIVCVARPRYFIMENVPQIRRSRIYKRVKTILKQTGYGLTEQILDASYYGVAQARRRLLLIGCLGEAEDWLVDHLVAAKSSKQMTVSDVLGPTFGKLHHLRRTPDGRKVWQASDDDHSLNAAGTSSGDEIGLSHSARNNDESVRFFWLDAFWKSSDVGSRRTDRPITTITGSLLARPSVGYPVKPGKDVEDISILPIPTFEQLAMLGGFPASWDWSSVTNKDDLMQILANAVPPAMAESVGRCIVAHHKGERAPVRMDVPRGFKSWLAKEQRYKEPRLSQVLSEFKAVQQFIGSRKPDDLKAALELMDRIPEFQALSSARKSNLRKALRLYVECADSLVPKPIERPEPVMRPVPIRRLRRLTSSGDASTI